MKPRKPDASGSLGVRTSLLKKRSPRGFGVTSGSSTNAQIPQKPTTSSLLFRHKVYELVVGFWGICAFVELPEVTPKPLGLLFFSKLVRTPKLPLASGLRGFIRIHEQPNYGMRSCFCDRFDPLDIFLKSLRIGVVAVGY